MKHKLLNKLIKYILVTVLMFSLIQSEGYSSTEMTPAERIEAALRKVSTFLSMEYTREGVQRLMKVTAYCSGPCCCGEYADGFTATGKEALVENRIVAVDPGVIPLHSKICIEGLGIYNAEDVGGMIKGNHIDILMESHDKALEWGVRERVVTVLN